MNRDDLIRRGDALDAFAISANPRNYIEKLIPPVNDAREALRPDGGISVVRCADCVNCSKDDDFTLWCIGRGWPSQLVAPDGYCDKGRRKQQ